MKVEVIKESVIHQHNIYREGDTFEVDEKVALSLLDRGYVGIIDGPGVGEALKGQILDLSDKECLANMEYNNLVKLAKDLGLKGSGKKDEIIERIIEFQANEDNADDDNGENNGEDEDGSDDEGTSDDELPNTSMPE